MHPVEHCQIHIMELSIIDSQNMERGKKQKLSSPFLMAVNQLSISSQLGFQAIFPSTSWAVRGPSDPATRFPSVDQ